MLRRSESLTLIAFLGLSLISFADQITLKNGDRLTGTVVKSDGKTLVLHTDEERLIARETARILTL